MKKQKESSAVNITGKTEKLVLKARNKFINFIELVNPEYDAQWFHEVIADKLQTALQRLEDGISSRIVIEMPPQHGKSEEATINFPAYVLGKHPEWPIITASYTSDLAVKFGFKTRDIMNSNIYQAIFKTRIREDSRAKGNWITEEGGGYMARGIGGSTTGSGFKIGIIDDPFKDRQEAESRNARDRVWDWYTSTFMTRQQGATLVVVINTRWHLDDLVARIEKLEDELARNGTERDVWEFITFPAIAAQDETHRKKGEALWPSRFPLEFLEKAKSRSLYDFESLYQQNPISRETQIFKREWFRYFHERDIKFKDFQCYTLIDPAISERETADNWVVLTVGKERTSPNIFRLEESAGKGNINQLINAVFYHQARYNSQVWLETIAFQKILKRDIKEDQKARQQYFQIHELKHAKNKTKYGRILALVPLYDSGVVFHRAEDAEYEKELMDFPMGDHDDRIDAMSFLNEAMFERLTEYEMAPMRKSETVKTLDIY